MFTIFVGHCENTGEFGLYNEKKILQGQACYRGGSAGIATGDHVHMEVSIGDYAGLGWENGHIKNMVSPTEVFYVDKNLTSGISDNPNHFQWVYKDSFPPTDPVDIGDDFYASVLLRKPWLSIRPSGDTIVMGSSKQEEMLWHFERQSDGRYMIRNAGTGKYLTAYGGYTEVDHTEVIQKEYTGSYAQRWTVFGTSGSYFLSASKPDGTPGHRVISPVGNGQSGGTALELMPYTGSEYQMFSVYKVTDVSAIKSEAALGDRFYASVFPGDQPPSLRIAPTADGENILLGGERDKNAAWYFEKQSDGSYLIQNVGTGEYLTVYSGFLDDHNRISMKYKTGSYAQRWHIYGRWSGDYYFTPRTGDNSAPYEKKVISICGGTSAAGASLELLTVDWSAAQRFSIYTIEKVTAAEPNVNAGLAGEPTEIRWTDNHLDSTGARVAEEYEIRIWKDAAEGDPFRTLETSENRIETELQQGHYILKLISRNFFSEAESEPVEFDVEGEMDEPDLLLPADLKTIEEEAFAGTEFKVVKCPEGLEEIRTRAFAACTQLRQIYIPASTETIAEDAFEGCVGLTIIGKEGSAAERFALRKQITFQSC